MSNVRQIPGLSVFGILLLVVCAPQILARAQTNNNQQDESRDIGFNYAAARVRASREKPADSSQRYTRRTPPLKAAIGRSGSAQSKGSQAGPGVRSQLAQIGLTAWLLRPAKTGDEKRTVFQDAKTNDEFTPVRVEAGHQFAVGDRIRLSVESPREGYLYIVDREMFADGSTGPAYLVFPTKGIRGGNNLVSGGVLTDLPAPDEPPLRLQPSGENVVGELFTFIFSPKPLLIPPLSENSAALPPDIFANWLKWETQTESFELVGGAGQAWTVAEKESAATNTRLKANDPLPQNTFRLWINRDQPILVNLSLRYKKL